MVAHTYNYSYLGGRDREYQGLRRVQTKVSDILSQQLSQALWFMLVIPATWEAICRRIVVPVQIPVLSPCPRKPKI
jgi:hypothetical protein